MRYLPGEPSWRKLAWPDNTALLPIIMWFNTSADFPQVKGRGEGNCIHLCVFACMFPWRCSQLQRVHKQQPWKGIRKLFCGAVLCQSVCCQTMVLTLPNYCILRFLNYSKRGDVEYATNTVPSFGEQKNLIPCRSFILQQKELIHFCVICSLALHFSEVSLEQLVTFLHCLEE